MWPWARSAYTFVYSTKAGWPGGCVTTIRSNPESIRSSLPYIVSEMNDIMWMIKVTRRQVSSVSFSRCWKKRLKNIPLNTLHIVSSSLTLVTPFVFKRNVMIVYTLVISRNGAVKVRAQVFQRVLRSYDRPKPRRTSVHDEIRHRLPCCI